MKHLLHSDIARIEMVDGVDCMGHDVGIETQGPAVKSQWLRRSATRYSNAVNHFERRYRLYPLCNDALQAQYELSRNHVIDLMAAGICCLATITKHRKHNLVALKLNHTDLKNSSKSSAHCMG